MFFWRSKSAKRAVDTTSSDARDASGDAAQTSDEKDAAAASPSDASVSKMQDDAAVDAPAVEANAVAGERDDAASQGDDAEIAAAGRPDGDDSTTGGDAAGSGGGGSKVVSIATAQRLSERLAEVIKVPATTGGAARGKAAVASKAELQRIEPQAAPEAVLAVHRDAQRQIEAALSGTDVSLAGQVPAHILVFGAPGTGRIAAVEASARVVARQRSRGDDCIYVSLNGDDGSHLAAFRVPAGTGHAIRRDVGDALMKASAMLVRHVAGDGHQMSLAMLEEDHRQKSSGGIEHLRRRAEAQNIALVNTSEGFVLAPMHEGRVVRADVFRALPEALQRDVEAKITAFEGELQSLLQALPGSDIATDDRHVALCQQTAERALKPSMAVARKLTSAADGAGPLIDAVEAEWLRNALDYVRRGEVGGGLEPPVLSVASVSLDGGEEGAPVVVAHAAGAGDLVGEVGRDGKGRIVVKPGALARASGGFVIVEAWRLGNDPEAYAVLSAALDSGEVVPKVAAGVAVSAEATPLTATVVIVGDPASLKKLKAIDPGVERHFVEVVRFDATAAAFDVNEERFTAWARALSEAANLSSFDKACGPILYDDARSRAGDMSRVSLDRRALLATLALAERKARAAKRERIGVEDLKAALASRAILHRLEDLS